MPDSYKLLAPSQEGGAVEVVCTHLDLGGGCSREFGDWLFACVLLHLEFHH